MTIDDKIRDEKLQYDINREAVMISALSSAKIDKYEHLTDEAMLPSDQRETIEQAKFAQSLLRKAFEKQTKPNQVGAIKSLGLSNRKEKNKEIEGIFPQNLIKDFVCAKLKEIVSLQHIKICWWAI